LSVQVAAHAADRMTKDIPEFTQRPVMAYDRESVWAHPDMAALMADEAEAAAQDVKATSNTPGEALSADMAALMADEAEAAAQDAKATSNTPGDTPGALSRDLQISHLRI
jgi:hypothetical protein